MASTTANTTTVSTTATAKTTTTTTTTTTNHHNDNTGHDRYLVLVEFAYKHLNFQIAELQSVLDMHGIELGSPDCQIVPLPNEETPSSTTTTTTTTETSTATATTCKNNAFLSSYRHERPFVILSFPAQDAERLSTNEAMGKWDCSGGPRARSSSSAPGIGEMLQRCALVRSVVELWGYATDIPPCARMAHAWAHASSSSSSSLEGNINNNNDSSSSSSSSRSVGTSIFQRVARPDKSWKLTVHTLGNKFSREEQDGMRKHFSILNFPGPVQMKDFDNEFILIREVEMDTKGNPKFPRHAQKELIPEHAHRPPLGVYFGRVIGGVRKGRGGLEQYNLKNRAYLGPTSMDAELSFVMTSFGQVQKGSIVYDPFVGTGSILLSCALRGALCMGSDIDIRILKGKSDSENIWKNFEQYQLQRPEILRTDNAIYHRHFRSHGPLYDSIICDPPYGIRAGARKTGSRSDNPRPVLDEHRHDHIAQTKPYSVSDVMSDLLDMAARSLAIGGRLVYVIPSFADFNPDTDLPQHDCLELVHCCYQPLSLELGRRIVAMRKVADYDPSRRDEYLQKTWLNGAESAEKCANLRDKILENAKKKPDYEKKAAVRKQKRKEHKEVQKAAKRAKREAEGMPVLEAVAPETT